MLVWLVVAGSSNAADGPGPLASLGWLAVIFACVTVHELAHSIVARGRGVRVRGIVLLPIGGVSQLESVPDHWPTELAIAVAGPAASLGIALLGLLGAAAWRIPLLPIRLVDGPLLHRLGWLNLMLAGFNLLPAFPMDGGRVLRALLERHRSPLEATDAAAHVGRALGMAMVAVGVLVYPWLALIGMFIVITAGAEAASAHLRSGAGPPVSPTGGSPPGRERDGRTAG